MPVLLADKLTKPDVEFKLKPTGVEENEPPVVNPLANVGLGLDAF